ncbi:serine protease [Massilia sp. CCM 8733]|uniref:Serine protease n=1 Tax=Massilia mucilaginosa TaxID=2609282 RepID=A0ABX0NSB8_9BURK|nr:serine protease [Massilia mucilaginosa]NHZ89645.1 serine protease [Massilia mucilaginosa]
MEAYSLEQLRAVLEARALRRTAGLRPRLRVDKRALEGLTDVTDHTEVALTEWDFHPDVVLGVDPFPGVSSETLFQELLGRQKVLYGDDDRVEVIDCNDLARQRNARSVAAIVERGTLFTTANNQVSVSGATLEHRYFSRGKPLCQKVDFRHQPCAAVGTAFLVVPAIVATAHHCLGPDTIDSRCLIFDFETDANGVAPLSFGLDQIYGIRRFIGGTFTSDGEDWSLIELDREVQGRAPLALRSAVAAPDNAPLYVIGHPSGLPKKVAGNAEIRFNTAASHFVANLDTFGGNSGSPVFNGITHEVEGILVRGDADFVPLGNCYASLICPISGCRGEDCSRIAPITRLLALQV